MINIYFVMIRTCLPFRTPKNRNKQLFDHLLIEEDIESDDHL